MPTGDEPAPSPPSESANQEQGPAPPRRRAFETALMRALPLPSSPPAEPPPPEPPPPQPPPAVSTPEPAWMAAALDPLRSPVIARELPGLRRALDQAISRPRLEELLADGYTLERCVPGKALYTPGAGCTLRYQLELRETASGRRVDRLVGGRLFGDAAAAEAYLHDRLEPLLAGAARAGRRRDLAPFARPVAVVEPLRLALHVFPLDGELPSLLAATDSLAMAAMLRGAVDDGFTVERCRVELVEYASPGRCTLRYHLDGRGGDGAAATRVVYGKVDNAGQGEQAGLVAAALAERFRAAGFDVAVPRPLGYRPDLRLALTEAAPGAPRVVPLVRARVAGGEPPAGLTLDQALVACARIAAAVHASGVPLGVPRTLAGEIGALDRDLVDVTRAAPVLGPRLAACIGEAEALAARSRPQPSVLAHGDFTPARVLHDGGRFSLVDFDAACRAEPALDLGHFLAHLRVAVCAAEAAAGQAHGGLAAELAGTFLTAYAEAAPPDAGWVRPQPGDLRGRAAAYEAVGLVRLAVRSWYQLRAVRVRTALAAIDTLRFTR
jgi:aminoglycoside phosphotransferase (APT) family kinase protein